MKYLYFLFLLSYLSLHGQEISPTYIFDDFSQPLKKESMLTYSTLYPHVYEEITRDTLGDQLIVKVNGKIGEWRPVVIGTKNLNEGKSLNLSFYPITKVRIIVPDTSSTSLKFGMYISDGKTLGEYDAENKFDFGVKDLKPGTDTILVFDWTLAKSVDWNKGWPPQTVAFPDLSHIESIGFSMNTNMDVDGVYVIKSIEFGSKTNDKWPPKAVDDFFSVLPQEKKVLNLLENDRETDSKLDSNSIQIVEKPSFGKLQFSQKSKSYVYKITNNKEKSDSFSYQVCDETGLCDEAKVFIQIERPKN